MKTMRKIFAVGLAVLAAVACRPSGGKDLIVSINRTNQETVWEGKTLTEIIAEKDTLSMHIAALRSALDAANVRSDRYSRNEIKFVRTIDVNALQKRVDDLSRDLRQLDSQLQQANWTTDLK